MKAAELRIGNYIQVRKGKIVPMIIHDLNLMLEWERVKYSRTPPIKPVPLTEEWLLKFGFTVGNLKNCYFKDWGTNGVESVVFEYHYKGGFEYELGSNRYKVIEYVHQLQNLYFALTGEELITAIA